MPETLVAIPEAPKGRYWKRDLAKLQSATGSHRATVTFAAPSGVVTGDLALAATHAPNALGSALARERDVLGAIAADRSDCGAFVFIPNAAQLDEPIVVTYTFAGNAFPRTLVVAGDGARATVIERFVGAEGAVVCGLLEIVTGERSEIDVACLQGCAGDALVVTTRRALVGRDAQVRLGLADLGADHALDDARLRLEHLGGDGKIAGLFFANGDQHVDVRAETDHMVGETTSETVFKTAASASGQARFLGTIKIVEHAHGSDAALRDDALLLSKRAHIDSVPALEIAANDVKAFHGATVGAIDEDEIFYAMSRGIDRAHAERMIALGFFEPAIARFPTEALREDLRAAIEAKLP